MEEAQPAPVIPVSPIANPLAGKKLTRKCLKLVQKSASNKQSIRRGVKSVLKALRKGEKGFVVLAGDVSPIDVVSPIPILCEESKLSYIYVPSREALGTACGTKRATSVVMIIPSEEHQTSMDEIITEVKEITPKWEQ